MSDATIQNLKLDMKSMIEKTKSLNNTISDIKQTMIKAKELKENTVLRTLMDLQPEIHNEHVGMVSKKCYTSGF